MKLTDVLKAVFYPLTQSSVLIPVVVLWLLMSFARWGGVLGLFMMFLVLPAVFRYQMMLLEARASGRVPPIPDTDFFRWFGNAWSLFPLPLVLAAGWLVIAAGSEFGTGGKIAALVFASALLPSSFAVLAITHSPLQSLNPVAISRLWSACGATFWIASVYLGVVGWLLLQSEALPTLLANLISMLLIASLFSVIGSLIEPYQLLDNVSIDEPLEPDEGEMADHVENLRTDVLTHAYGFLSRGNRDGGFKHITASIDDDTEPAAAWAWYFERMLVWEQKQHALFFAQLYIHDMLRHSEDIPALKVIMRCRLLDETFKPRSEDMPAAIAAAENSGNIELASVLKRH